MVFIKPLSKRMGCSSQHNIIYKKDYDFRKAHAPTFSLVEIPRYVFHRGVKNRSGARRMMFQMVFFMKGIEDIGYPSTVFVEDGGA